MKLTLLLASLSALILLAESLPTSGFTAIKKNSPAIYKFVDIEDEDIVSYIPGKHDGHGIRHTASNLFPGQESQLNVYIAHNPPPYVDPQVQHPIYHGEEESYHDDEHGVHQSYGHDDHGFHRSYDTDDPEHEDISHITEKHILGHDGHGIHHPTSYSFPREESQFNVHIVHNPPIYHDEEELNHDDEHGVHQSYGHDDHGFHRSYDTDDPEHEDISHITEKHILGHDGHGIHHPTSYSFPREESQLNVHIVHNPPIYHDEEESNHDDEHGVHQSFGHDDHGIHRSDDTDDPEHEFHIPHSPY